MSTVSIELLACPFCRGGLTEVPDGLLCSACGTSYPVRNGVPNLVLGAPAESEERPPGFGGRALASIVAVPFVYDLVQRLAGAEPLHRRMRPMLDQAAGALVLDAGAGTGNVERLLPATARYLWLDPDPQKLHGFRAKSRAPALIGDATRIPLRDGSVDWAVSVGVSHHVDDEGFARMLDELRRVTRDRLFFLDAVVAPALTSRLLWHYDRGRHPRSAEALRSALAKRFRIMTDEEFTIRHRYLLVTAR